MVRLKYNRWRTYRQGNHVSIPNGSIKIDLAEGFEYGPVQFQFQMVRLKFLTLDYDDEHLPSFNSKWFD